MALQTSGAISLNDIHVEAGGSSGASATINDSDIRGLIGKGSGATMSFSEWYGAANQFTFSITSNTQNANIRTLAVAAGWNGTAEVVATVNSNVWLWSDSASTGGAIISGSFPGGLTLNNYGKIIGKGGNGGSGASSGGSGGPALTVATSGVSVSNKSGAYIAGGGGAGGSGGYGEIGRAHV